MIAMLAQLKANLRIESDNTDEDDFLTTQLECAQSAAEDFCGIAFDDAIAPNSARLAVILMASHFYNNRENADKNAYDAMITAFHALLWPYRSTAVLF